MTRLIPRWNDLPLRAKGLAVIAIPLVPLLVSAVLLVRTVRRERFANDRVTHTLEVKAQIATTLSLLVDAETGVRGYLLTHSPDALRPYNDCVARWPVEFARLAVEPTFYFSLPGASDRWEAMSA